MDLKYVGEITKESIKLLKEGITVLKWGNPNLKMIIFERICPNSKCGSNLYFADRWYDKEQIVVFIRLCTRCRKVYSLCGHFKKYHDAKEYFIGLFRINKLNKLNRMEEKNRLR